MDEDTRKEAVEINKVLKERAKILAREIVIDEEHNDTVEITEFIVAGEHYGIENCFIREVFLMKEFTPLPGVPNYVFGIINVRGKIMSVLDMRYFFDLPITDISDYKKVIIISNNSMEFGILSNDIIGVRQFVFSELELSLPTLTDVRAEYLKGITKDRVIVLDGEKILNDKSIIVHQNVFT